MPDAVAPRPPIPVWGTVLAVAALAVPFVVGTSFAHAAYRAAAATGPSVAEPAFASLCAALGAAPERVAAAALLAATAGLAAAFAPPRRRGVTALVALCVGASLVGRWILPLDPGAATAMIAAACVATATALARIGVEAPKYVIGAFVAGAAAPLFHPLGFLAAVPIATALSVVPGVSNETVLRRSAPLVLWGLASPILIFAPSTIGLIVALRAGAPVDAPADWFARLLLVDVDAAFMEGVFRWWLWALLHVVLFAGLRAIGRRGETSGRLAAGGALLVAAPLPWMLVPTGYAADGPFLPGAWTAFPGFMLLVATLFERGLFAVRSVDQDRARPGSAIAGLVLATALFMHTPAPRRNEWNLRAMVDAAAKAAAGAPRVRIVVDPDLAAALPDRFLRMVAETADRPIDSLGLAPTVERPTPIPDDVRLLFVNRPPQATVTAPFEGTLPFPCTMPMGDADVAGAWLAPSKVPPIPEPHAPWTGQWRCTTGDEEFVSPIFRASEGDRFGVVLEFGRNDVAAPGGRIALVREDGLAEASTPLDSVGILAKAGVVAPADGDFRLRVRPSGGPGTFTLVKLSLNAKRRGP